MSGSMGRHLQRSLGVGCTKPKSCPLQLTAVKATRIAIKVKQICSRLLNLWLIDTLRCYRQPRDRMAQYFDINSIDFSVGVCSFFLDPYKIRLERMVQLVQT